MWTGVEIKNFETAILKHDKSFSEIAQEVGTKTVKQCIEFYYLWKKVMSDGMRKKWRTFKKTRLLDDSDSIEQNLRSSTANESKTEATTTGGTGKRSTRRDENDPPPPPPPAATTTPDDDDDDETGADCLDTNNNENEDVVMSELDMNNNNNHLTSSSKKSNNKSPSPASTSSRATGGTSASAVNKQCDKCDMVSCLF